MYRPLIEQAEKYLKSLNSGDNIAAELKSRLADLMARGEANADAACRALKLSRRTLQRRLSEAGVTHTALVEHARCDMALRKLKATRLPIGQVAKELGFRDPSSFSRAFQRWTGMSPRAYRRILRQTAVGTGEKPPNIRSTDRS